MQGITVKIDEKKNEATIVVKLDGDFGISGSGKSRIVATTSGNQSLTDGIKFGLNVYKPVKK